MHKFPETEDQISKATLSRRLAAMFYDTLLCIALLMVTTGIYMTVSHAILGAEAYKALNESGKTINDPLLSSTLFVTLFIFFGYFWTKTGQTLGMQVWHIRIQTPDNTTITWNQALVRFFTAWASALCFGLGYAWILIDKNNKSWQCLASDSVVVKIPKPIKNKRA